MIDTFEKKGVRGLSVVEQRQQLSIEILTNLSIKISPGIIVNLPF